MNTICAVVVTYNGMKWIDKCIASLRASSVDLQIIVVDNCSKDNTANWIRDNYQEVELIENDENSGFGPANNIGIKKALAGEAQYIFLLNQDAWIEPDAIEHLIECAEKDPVYGIVSPFHLNGRGDKFDVGFNFYLTTELQKNRTFNSNLFFGKYLDRAYPVDFVNAAGWLLTHETLKKVGGFDPLFTHWGEDNNYIQRLVNKKLKLGICAKSIMYHDREDSFVDRNGFDADLYYRALLIDLLNPNNQNSLGRTKRKIIIDAIMALFKGKKGEINTTINAYLRFSQNKKEIMSRTAEYKVEYCFLE